MAIKKQYILAILSGVLVGTSYIPFPPWALFFCLIPLWWTWQQELTYKRVFFLGWITQFTLTIIGFHWIPHTIVEFGRLPSPIGVLGLVAFASFSCLHIPLSGVIWKFLKNKINFPQSFGLFLLAYLTYLFERMNPQVFPWNFGYAWMWGNIPAFQLADTIGFEGLSFLTFTYNAWLLLIIINFKDKVFLRNHVLFLLVSFTIINSIGFWKFNSWSIFDSEQNVLVTQANIGNLEKQWKIYGRQYKEPTIDKFIQLSQNYIDQSNPKPDWILWPETAIPEFMEPENSSKPVYKKVIEFVDKNKVPLVSGAYSRNPETKNESNAIFFFDRTGSSVGIYKKSILLAFGEYLPGSQWFPFLLKLFPEVSDFERGGGPDSIPFMNNNLGPQICYEGLHPWFVSETVKRGANLLVNVTNDSWFGHTFESYQHLYMTLARAIEFRRPLIRATNTGISSAILANGQVLNISPQKTEWVGTFNLKFLKSPPLTVYNHIGMFLPVLFLIPIIGAYFGFSRKP